MEVVKFEKMKLGSFLFVGIHPFLDLPKSKPLNIKKKFWDMYLFVVDQQQPI